ncbi:MAG TPA: hypothetical protein VIX18_00310, partial [Nitrospirota bacterium]
TALIAWLLSIAGYFLVYQQTRQRLFMLVMVSAASALSLMNGDVYSVHFFFIAAAVPWILYAVRDAGGRLPYLVFPCVAFLASATNIIRSHAGTSVAIFGLVLLALAAMKSRKKLVVILLMIATAVVPAVLFSNVVQERDSYLRRMAPDAPIADSGHPFWHSVYIGLGFIDNPHVDKYLDEVAIEKVRSIDPQARFLSREYSDILRREIIRIVREDPKFVIRTLAAKAGIISVYVLLFVNIGVWAAFAFRKEAATDAAFLLSMLFTSLFGLLVVPYTNYLLGFIGFASQYSIVSVNHALDNRTFGDILRSIRQGRRPSCAE